MKHRMMSSQAQQKFISRDCCNQLDQLFPLGLAVRRLWQSWVTEFNSNNTPRVWHTTDCLGNCWWHAYNPATGCSATRESELEILEWIDQGAIGE